MAGPPVFEDGLFEHSIDPFDNALDNTFNIYNLFEKERDDIKGVHYGKIIGSRIAD
jgi:hypothetical protein